MAAAKPHLLSNREAADFIGVQPHTLETWRTAKRYSIPYTKVGGKVYYFAEDLLDWLDSRRVGCSASGRTAELAGV